MAFQFTFTQRFQKHYKMLSSQEKNNLKVNLIYWQKTQNILLCLQKEYKALRNYMNPV